jgi:hypothetical protein
MSERVVSEIVLADSVRKNVIVIQTVGCGSQKSNQSGLRSTFIDQFRTRNDSCAALIWMMTR